MTQDQARLDELQEENERLSYELDKMIKQGHAFRLHHYYQVSTLELLVRAALYDRERAHDLLNELEDAEDKLMRWHHIAPGGRRMYGRGVRVEAEGIEKHAGPSVKEPGA